MDSFGLVQRRLSGDPETFEDERAIDFVINGRSLVDMFNSAADDGAIPLLAYAFSADRFLRDGRVSVLTCGCGSEGCGGSEATITVQPDRVVWTDFANPNRNRSAAIGPFVFDRAEYEAAIASTTPAAPVAIMLPDEVLRKVAALGAVGERWLDELGWVVAQLEIDWEIEVGEAISGGSGGFVANAQMRDGTSAVLKVAIPDGLDGHSPFEQELETLCRGEGRGYVFLFTFDRDRHAMLQERLGRPLSTLGLPVEDQIDIIAATLQQAWMRPPAPIPPAPATAEGQWIGVSAWQPLRTGADQARDLGESVQRDWEALGRPCPRATIEQAVKYARSRHGAFDAATAVLIHGDAHPANVLETGVLAPSPTGFQLIDPDGMLSEPAHDLAIPLRDWTEELLAADATVPGDAVALGLAWCARLGERARVDPQAIWEWAFLERVSTGLFLLRLGDTALGTRFFAVAALWTGVQP